MPPVPSVKGLTEDEILRNRVFTAWSEGWSDLLGLYSGLIKGRISSYRFSPDDAEDVYQEVCYRLVKEDAKLLSDWDPARGSLSNYLTLIVSSVCLNFLSSGYYAYHRKKLDPPKGTWGRWEIFALLEDPAPTPAERLQRLDRLRQFEAAIEAWADLNAISRNDLLLIRFRLSGMSYDELAKLLGITIVNARVRFHRLKRNLAEYLITYLQILRS